MTGHRIQNAKQGKLEVMAVNQQPLHQQLNQPPHLLSLQLQQNQAPLLLILQCLPNRLTQVTKLSATLPTGHFIGEKLS